MNISCAASYGDAFIDNCLGTSKYKDAKSVIKAYQNGQIDTGTERRLQVGHMAQAGLCIPRLALEVSIGGISAIATAILLPWYGGAAVGMIANELELRAMAIVAVGGTLALYGFVTFVVISSLSISAPALVAGGICATVAMGILQQFMGHEHLSAGRDFTRHIRWAVNPCKAAHAEIQEQRQRCLDYVAIAAKVSVMVVAVMVTVSLRYAPYQVGQLIGSLFSR